MHHTLRSLLLSIVVSSQPPTPAAVAGCWELSPPLGPSAVARLADSAFRPVILHARGGVGLPRLHGGEAAMWERRSRWSVNGPELELLLFTGLQGWRAILTRTGATQWTGRATYLSDAIVRGARPMERAVVLQAIACEAARRERPAVVPDPPLAQPHFSFQVDRPARLLSRRPSFMKTFRPLGYREVVAGRTGRSVLAQFVVTDTGRIAMWTVTYRRADGRQPSARDTALPADTLPRDQLTRALQRLRFDPARVGGKAVNVLEQYLVEW